MLRQFERECGEKNQVERERERETETERERESEREREREREEREVTPLEPSRRRRPLVPLSASPHLGSLRPALPIE